MSKFEIGGIDLAVPSDMLNDRLRAKLATGEYEAEEARAVEMRCYPNRKVLELGAGIGYITALCARKVGAEHVVTVEANPVMLPVIRQNLRRNGFDAVQVVHGAVTGDAPASETIGFDPKKFFWSGRIADDNTNPDKQIDVPALGLRDLLKAHQPHMVVMDVEGAEIGMFDEEWPRHVHNVILELHPKQYPDTGIKLIVDCMSASGLTYDPGPSRGRILGFRRLRHK